MAQRVKDLALSLLWLWGQQWCGYINPWSRNFCMACVQPGEKKKANAVLVCSIYKILWFVLFDGKCLMT